MTTVLPVSGHDVARRPGVISKDRSAWVDDSRCRQMTAHLHREIEAMLSATETERILPCE